MLIDQKKRRGKNPVTVFSKGLEEDLRRQGYAVDTIWKQRKLLNDLIGWLQVQKLAMGREDARLGGIRLGGHAGLEHLHRGMVEVLARCDKLDHREELKLRHLLDNHDIQAAVVELGVGCGLHPRRVDLPIEHRDHEGP